MARNIQDMLWLRANAPSGGFWSPKMTAFLKNMLCQRLRASPQGPKGRVYPHGGAGRYECPGARNLVICGYIDREHRGDAHAMEKPWLR